MPINSEGSVWHRRSTVFKVFSINVLLLKLLLRRGNCTTQHVGLYFPASPLCSPSVLTREDYQTTALVT